MATILRPRPRALCQCQRAFSTSTIRPVSLQLDKNDPEAVADTVPPYPYGPTRWYKQSRLGLYGGQRIQFGNNVGEKFQVKTRRTWHPNVHTRKLFSKALNREVQVRVTTRTLRTIDRLGGLDEYLLGEKEQRIKELGESGWWLRWAVMQTPAVKARFAEERKRLRVPEEVTDQVDVQVAEAGETLGTDGAPQVEQPPATPALKFRVGPHKHIVLTADGWRRTRPDPNRLPNLVKQRIFNDVCERTIPGREAEFLGMLEKEQRSLEPEQYLTWLERAQMLKLAKRQWRKELKQQVAVKYDAKTRRARKRREKKKDAAALRNAERKVLHDDAEDAEAN